MDGAWPRYEEPNPNSVILPAEEDRCEDEERAHDIAERAGLFVFSSGFRLAD